jgi:outer membrane receptor protein involved in Fe transport
LSTLVVPRSAAGAQEPTTRVQGGVSDGVGGAPVVAAEVRILERGLSTLTAEDGSFVFPAVPPGTFTIRVDRIGYRVARQALEVGSTPVTLQIALTVAALQLAEIIVTPGRFGVMGDATVRQQQTLTREDLETVPQVGEDVFRVLRTLPGVAMEDISIRLHVRGGSDKELLTLLDGMELYAPYHLKDFDGVFGIIDVQSVGGIELMTGGFGAEYGDKLTGVFSMRSRNPPVAGTRTTLSLSVSNVSVLTRGSFGEGRGQWLFQARRGYLDLLLALTDNDEIDAIDEEISPKYFDVFGKVQYQIGTNHRLAAHVLYAGDNLTFVDPEARVESTWSSAYGWLTWDAVYDRLSVTTMAFGGGLDRVREGGIDNEFAILGPNFLFLEDRRDFRFGGVKQDVRVDLGERLLLKLGAEAKRLEADYDYFSETRQIMVCPSGLVGNASDTVDFDLDPSGSEVAGYLAARVRPVDPLTAEIGMRYDRVSHTDDSDVSPRLLTAFQLDDATTLRASWGRYYQSQGVHELEVGDGEEQFFSSDRAVQLALGVEHRFLSDLSLRLEVYRRSIDDQRPRFVNTDREIAPFPEAAGDRIRIDPGEGLARGIELLASFDRGGAWDWSASYVLSEAKDRIDGVWVPRTLDQRHALGLTAAYRRSGAWQFSGTFQYHTGWPATESSFVVDALPGITIVRARRIGDLNELRLPAYHRLDFRVSRNFNIGGGLLQAYLDVFNLYNRTNLRGYAFSPRVAGGRFSVLRTPGEEMLPILPSIGLRWEF